MNAFLCTSLALLLTVSQRVAAAKSSKSRPKAKGKSKLAIGIIIAIIVVVVIGLAVCGLAVFCLFKCLRGRKRAIVPSFGSSNDYKKEEDIEGHNLLASQVVSPHRPESWPQDDQPSPHVVTGGHAAQYYSAPN